jgi:hypothetical protein
MAKFRCACGEVITTSGAIPNPNEWLYISDVASDAGVVRAWPSDRRRRRLGNGCRGCR